jgi:hypothetical protein
MKGRVIGLFCGVVFSVTLALVVGQRLSAEGMAVVIGVIAGVATSIPTSLMVMWFMSHTIQPTLDRAAPSVIDAAPARQAEPVEPRIVVMPAPQPQPAGYPGLAGYGPQSFAGYTQAAANAAYATAPAMPARRFTVIGGSDGAVEEPAYLAEGATWER